MRACASHHPGDAMAVQRRVRPTGGFLACIGLVLLRSSAAEDSGDETGVSVGGEQCSEQCERVFLTK